MHWYSKEGDLLPPGEGYPSVTTILDVRDKKGLYAWRERVGAEAADLKAREASLLGTRVHSAIENLLHGEAVDEYLDIIEYLTGFMNWEKKAKPQKIQTEMFVFSELHEYAGTADLICELDGEMWIVDHKTGKARPEYALQLAAYAQAYYEMTGTRVRRATLQLTDEIKRGYRFKEYADDNDFGVFMAHKEIFDWQRSHEKIRQPALTWAG